MPQTYTSENFDPSVIPSGFNSTARDTMRLGVSLGWKLLVTNGGHCTLIAPPPNERITINVSQRKSDGPVKGIRAKLHKYASPYLAVADDGSNVVSSAQRALANEDRAAAKRAAEAKKKYEADQEAAKQAAVAAADGAMDSVRTEPAFISADEDLVLPDDEPVRHEPPTEADRAARTIVRTGPMISRKGSRRGYTSEVATEREWSDGTIEYVCSVVDCTSGPDGGPYVTENRLGVGPHRKVHLHSGEVERFDQSKALSLDVPEVEPAYTKTYTPRDDRLRSLALALLGKLIALGPDLTDNEKADALAAVALEWSHERTGLGLGTSGEPLTDEQVLARIRSLVDNGLYQRQADEAAALRAEKVALEERATAAEAAAEAAREETQRVRSDVGGLADLLAEFREGSGS